MTDRPRKMRLTEQLVAQVPPFIGGPNSAQPVITYPTAAEYDGWVQGIVAGAPTGGDVWLFGYGSLIWNPACDFVEERIGSIVGWRRSFCLGWTTVYRASVDRPGLMLALDRGGQCTGVVYRLPPDAVEGNLNKLVRREIFGHVAPVVPRWLTVQTSDGPVRAVAFVMDRNSGIYAGGVDINEVAGALATAAGERGTMAEYLYSTVKHLEERGIHDGHLWQLQELVAERIESAAAQGLWSSASASFTES